MPVPAVSTLVLRVPKSPLRVATSLSSAWTFPSRSPLPVVPVVLEAALRVPMSSSAVSMRVSRLPTLVVRPPISDVQSQVDALLLLLLMEAASRASISVSAVATFVSSASTRPARPPLSALPALLLEVTRPSTRVMLPEFHPTSNVRSLRSVVMSLMSDESSAFNALILLSQSSHVVEVEPPLLLAELEVAPMSAVVTTSLFPAMIVFVASMVAA
mmetsp:Transcript_49918/g.120920  ORF Transcript_49918/g.120920 Transcript_49918/m.120920 type:complete len:215 (-) Transcript_49918:1680-2324(-)